MNNETYEQFSLPPEHCWVKTNAEENTTSNSFSQWDAVAVDIPIPWN
jgi:translation elongation factor P/translation initiation factor 5A